MNSVIFGAMAPPLTKQLKGLVWHHKARSFQKMADAIVLLSVHGYLTEAERHRARKRLLHAISQSAKGKAA